MKLHTIFFLFMATLVSCAATTSSSGGDSTTSSLSSSTTLVTLIWVTITRSDGGLATVQTTYSQSFSSLYSVVPTVLSGAIGIGFLSGTVGDIRSYLETTVNAAGRLSPASVDIGLDGSKYVYVNVFMAVVAVMSVFAM